MTAFFSFKRRIKARKSALVAPTCSSPGVVAQTVGLEVKIMKRKNEIYNRKKQKIKLFADDIIAYIKNPKTSI